MQSEFSAQSAGENEKPFFSDPSVYSVVNQNTPTISVFEILVFTRFMTEIKTTAFLFHHGLRCIGISVRIKIDLAPFPWLLRFRSDGAVCF
jgi:hypothetical protein